MTGTFVPEIWAPAMLASLKGRDLIDADLRHGHTITNPHTSEYLAARDKAVKEWEALTAKLEEAGYLGHTDCYECGGELVPITDTHASVWVWDETEDEYQARTTPHGEATTVTFRVVQP